MAIKTCAVIGMGLFGRSLAYELTKLGVEVLAVDRNGRLVDMVKEHVTTALCTDLTIPANLKDSGVLNADRIIVAIGENLEQSILVTAILFTNGAKNVYARAHSAIHAQVLSALGATRTVDPEEEMGARLAQEIYAPDVMSRITLSTGQQVVEVNAPEPLWGKTVLELDFRRRFQLNILAIKHADGSTARRKDDSDSGLPAPTDTINEGDTLVVIGSPGMISTFLDLT